MASPARSRRSALAKLPAQEASQIQEFLAFMLGSDMYGVALSRVREIVSPPPITEVPRASKDVIGVCSVRGLLVTVVDLRRRLRLSESPPTRLSRILLANTDSGEVIGLYVDEVRQVFRLAENQVEVAASVLGGEMSEYVYGIGRPPGELVILLDLGSIVVF
jgi:purine-binding chemotaxis protein CheW